MRAMDTPTGLTTCLALRRRSKAVSLFAAAACLAFSLAANSPFLHSAMHGHWHADHGFSSATGTGHAHEHAPSKPCKECDSCRIQNHFSFHFSPAVIFVAATRPADFETPPSVHGRSVSFVPGPVLGRAPPLFSF
jgi:hypothetical protein